MPVFEALLRIAFRVIDVLVWAVSFPTVMFGSNPMQSRAVQGDEAHRVAISPDDAERLLSTPASSEQTILDLVAKACCDNPDSSAFEERPYLGRGRQGKPVYGAAIHSTSFSTFKDTYEAFGGGLVASLGLAPLPFPQSQASTGDGFTEIKSKHCLVVLDGIGTDFLVALLGAWSHSVVVATIAASVGNDALTTVMQDTNACAVLCSYADAPRLTRLAIECPQLKHVIYSTSNIPADYPSLRKSVTLRGGSGGIFEKKRELRVLSFGEIVHSGRFEVAWEGASPTQDHLALISYTAGGTTGIPKGVMIAHLALLSAVVISFRQLRGAGIGKLVATIQLSHVQEMVLEFAVLSLGGTVAHANPDENMFEDQAVAKPIREGSTFHDGNGASGLLEAFKPAMLSGSPKCYRAIQAEITKIIDAKGPLYRAALSASKSASLAGRRAPFSAIFLRFLRNHFSFRVAISSGSALSLELQNFVQAALGCHMIVCYGCTETCGTGCFQDGSRGSMQGVGGPMTGVQVRMLSTLGTHGEACVLDQNGFPYLATDTLHLSNECLSRGQIMLKSPAIASGYYRNKELTEEAFREDGFVKTGDLGFVSTNGAIVIVSRVTSLEKTVNGEYCAIEKMEDVFNESAFVRKSNGGCMVYVDANMNHPVALVQASAYDIKRYADSVGEGYMSFEELCENPRIQRMVLDDLNQIGQGSFRGGSGASRNLVHATWAPNIYMSSSKPLLSKHEKLAAVALIPGSGSEEECGNHSPFTPQNGCLDGIGNLHRAHIKSCFAETLSELIEKQKT